MKRIFYDWNFVAKRIREILTSHTVATSEAWKTNTFEFQISKCADTSFTTFCRTYS